MNNNRKRTQWTFVVIALGSSRHSNSFTVSLENPNVQNYKEQHETSWNEGIYWLNSCYSGFKCCQRIRLLSNPSVKKSFHLYLASGGNKITYAAVFFFSLLCGFDLLRFSFWFQLLLYIHMCILRERVCFGAIWMARQRRPPNRRCSISLIEYKNFFAVAKSISLTFTAPPFAFILIPILFAFPIQSKATKELLKKYSKTYFTYFSHELI